MSRLNVAAARERIANPMTCSRKRLQVLLVSVRLSELFSEEMRLLLERLQDLQGRIVSIGEPRCRRNVKMSESRGIQRLWARMEIEMEQQPEIEEPPPPEPENYYYVPPPEPSSPEEIEAEKVLVVLHMKNGAVYAATNYWAADGKLHPDFLRRREHDRSG